MNPAYAIFNLFRPYSVNLINISLKNYAPITENLIITYTSKQFDKEVIRGVANVYGHRLQLCCICTGTAW
jgi:hypothetical protein